MIGTIYLIVNHSTGKIYVGQTVKPDLRKYLRRKVCDALNQTHAKTRNGSPYLYNAIRKYGAAAFKIYALVSGITGRDLLNRSEQFFIKAFRSRTPGIGYNMTVGGDGGGTGADNPFFGKTHSNATKARLRESRIGRPMLPETKALIAATHRAKSIRPHRGSANNIPLRKNARLALVEWGKTTPKKQRRIYGRIIPGTG